MVDQSVTKFKKKKYIKGGFQMVAERGYDSRWIVGIISALFFFNFGSFGIWGLAFIFLNETWCGYRLSLIHI